MGAFVKSGSRPIQGVIRVAERPPHPGLWIMDTVPDEHFMQFGHTNPNDTEGSMDLLSSGAQINLFVAGRGSVIGSPISPIIKVAGNQKTFRRIEGDMDFNAGRILTGEITLDEAGEELREMVVQVARGQASKSEQIGHREYFHVQTSEHAFAGRGLSRVRS
jgi:altronate dehydratase large subunit